MTTPAYRERRRRAKLLRRARDRAVADYMRAVALPDLRSELLFRLAGRMIGLRSYRADPFWRLCIRDVHPVSALWWETAEGRRARYRATLADCPEPLPAVAARWPEPILGAGRHPAPMKGGTS